MSSSLTQTPTDRGSDERRRVSDVVQAFSFDEVRHVGREVLVVGLHIVLQDQAAQRAGGLVLKKKGSKNAKREIHVCIILFMAKGRTDSTICIVSGGVYIPSDLRLVRTKMR